MPKSPVLYIANTALVGCGLLPIQTAALFATGLGVVPGQSLDKYQQKTVTGLNLLQKGLGMALNKRFMFKRFQFTTAANVGKYTINNCTVEGFRANSFVNVTFGGPANIIKVISFQTFQESWARADLIPIGSPQYLAPLEDDGEEHANVQLVPIPDQAYVIQGQARVDVPDLVDGNSPCLFPKRYEHALIWKLIEILEWSINEGRDVSAKAFAEQFLAEVMRDASGAQEEDDKQNLGFRLWGNRHESRRDYNPATDVAGPFP